MTLLPPAGAPDWSSEPVRASALLTPGATLNLPTGDTVLADVDVSRYAGVMLFVQGQSAGPRVRVWAQQCAKPNGFVLISEQFIVTKDVRRAILQIPVIGRYLYLVVNVTNVSGPTAPVQINAYGTAVPWVPPLSLQDGAAGFLGGITISAGASVTLDGDTWTPGRHRVLVDSSWAAWSAEVNGYNENNTLQCQYLKITNSNAQNGLTYPFTVGGYEPRLLVTNLDGVDRDVYVSWLIDP